MKGLLFGLICRRLVRALKCAAEIFQVAFVECSKNVLLLLRDPIRQWMKHSQLPQANQVYPLFWRECRVHRIALSSAIIARSARIQTQGAYA
jgi:hypothetical protein